MEMGGTRMNDNLYGKIFTKWTNAGWNCLHTGSDCESFRVHREHKGVFQHIQFDVVTGWYSLFERENNNDIMFTVNKQLGNRINWTLDKIAMYK
jgi:hypothetical protein